MDQGKPINISTHRGRTKTGKIAIQIRLTEDETKRLDRLAETKCRSRTMQATWMVLNGLRENR